MPQIKELPAASSVASSDLVPVSQGGVAKQAALSVLAALFSPASPSAGATGTTRTPEQYGAVGDGVTDDTAAVNQALRAGVAGDRVLLAPGKTYAHSAVLGGPTSPVTAGITIDAWGAALLATTPGASSLWIQANNVTVNGLTLRVKNLAGRLGSWETYRLLAKDCSGFVANLVTVIGSAAAGIFMHNADGFRLNHAQVRDTLADGIHVSVGSRNGKINRPIVSNVGDDGVAIVSYVNDPQVCKNVEIIKPEVWSQTNGRGVTIVGGDNIHYWSVYVRRSWGAGVYIAQEVGDYNTYPVTNCSVVGGVLEEVHYTSSVDHAGVLLLNQVVGNMTDVQITDLSVDVFGGKVAFNAKNSNTTGAQFLRCAFRRCRIKGLPNWLYPAVTDSQITKNPTPYATAQGVTFDDVVWVPPSERGRQFPITAATTLGDNALSGTYLCSGSSYTVTLPSAGGAPFPIDSSMTRKITVINTGTGTITVQGGGQINGGASVALAAKTGRTFVSDGSAWWCTT